MKKRLAASFLIVTGLCAAVAVIVPRLQPDPVWGVPLQVSLDVALGLAASVVVGRLLTTRLRLLASVAGEIRDGDLTRPIDTRGDDETADLARAFAGMQASLARVVAQARSTADRIHASALDLSETSTRMNEATAEIASTAHDIAQGTENQADEVRKTSERTRQLAGAVDDVAEAARTVSAVAQETSGRAESGMAEARRAAEAMATLSDKTAAAVAAVEGFQQRADDIGKAIAFIASLSQQTQLLAINAAIEAARAGDDARGFGVVADEVRRLADAVCGFADRISSLSDEIQQGSLLIAQGIRDSLHAVEETRAIVQRAGASFDGILDSAREAAARAREIAALTATQRDAALEVDGALAQISTIAARNVAGTVETSGAARLQNASMESLAASAKALALSSDELREMIAVFRTAS